MGSALSRMTSLSPRASLGAAGEDYLKAVYVLSLATGRVAPTAVAEKLGVSQPAVTKMVRRLQELQLVGYKRAEGITLTPAGRRIALEVIRHHRLLEAYLHQALGYSWDEVDREAEVLEHVISEEFEDRIDRLLGFPTHDPHGSPIPTKEGEIFDEELPTLGDVGPGRPTVVRRVNGRDPEMLRYLGTLGLYPEAKVTLLECAPYGGPVRVLVDGIERAIGPEVARCVFVAAEGEKR